MERILAICNRWTGSQPAAGRPLLLCLLVLASLSSAAEERIDAFGSQEAFDTFLTAPTVSASRLRKPKKNEGSTDDPRNYAVTSTVPVSPEMTRQVRNLFVNQRYFYPAIFKGCDPTYGIRFTFRDGAKTSTLDICLECAIVAFSFNNRYTGGNYFDGDEWRMMTIARALFPKDKELRDASEWDAFGGAEAFNVLTKASMVTASRLKAPPHNVYQDPRESPVLTTKPVPPDIAQQLRDVFNRQRLHARIARNVPSPEFYDTFSVTFSSGRTRTVLYLSLVDSTFTVALNGNLKGWSYFSQEKAIVNSVLVALFPEDEDLREPVK